MLAFLNTPSVLIDRVVSLADAIPARSPARRRWLKVAIEAHLTGQPIPPEPRGR